MDRELEELHDLARNMLIDVQRQLLAKQPVPGFSPSDLKRVRKALSNLDTDFQSYGDIMSNNVGDPKGLMKAIRNGETAVMKAFELMPDDTIHHLIQQRTGGDFSLAVDGEQIREVVRRLQQRYQMRFGQASGPDGVVRGDTAFSNFAHKSDDKATGLERRSGIGKNPDPSTTSHRYGTAGYAKDFTPEELATVDSLEEAFINRIDPQLADLKVGQATDAPRVQAVREIPGLERAYRADNTAAEIADMKKIVKATPVDVLQDTYTPLVNSSGSVRFNNRAFKRTAALIPLAGAGIGLTQMSAQAAQGDYMGAAATGIETAVGEIPVVGDALVNEFQGRSAGAGSDMPSTDAQRQMVYDYEARPASKIVNDPLNELEWAAKNPGEALKNISENDAVQATGNFLKKVGGAVVFGF